MKDYKVIDSDGITSRSLDGLLGEFDMKLRQTPDIQKQIVLRYHNMICANKKQRQTTKPQAGLHSVRIPQGTNRGMSRQKRSSSGTRSVVSGAPNNRTGRVAHWVNTNAQKINMNKKQKKLAIKILLIQTLRNANLYVIGEGLTNLKTSLFFKHLRNVDSLDEEFDNTTRNSFALCCSPKLTAKFKNFSKCLNLNGTSFFGLYNGATTKRNLIFTQSELIRLISERFPRR